MNLGQDTANRQFSHLTTSDTHFLPGPGVSLLGVCAREWTWLKVPSTDRDSVTPPHSLHVCKKQGVTPRPQAVPEFQRHIERQGPDPGGAARGNPRRPASTLRGQPALEGPSAGEGGARTHREGPSVPKVTVFPQVYPSAEAHGAVLSEQEHFTVCQSFFPPVRVARVLEEHSLNPAPAGPPSRLGWRGTHQRKNRGRLRHGVGDSPSTSCFTL